MRVVSATDGREQVRHYHLGLRAADPLKLPEAGQGLQVLHHVMGDRERAADTGGIRARARQACAHGPVRAPGAEGERGGRRPSE